MALAQRVSFSVTPVSRFGIFFCPLMVTCLQTIVLRVLVVLSVVVPWPWTMNEPLPTPGIAM
jgi:hypothetical protein